MSEANWTTIITTTNGLSTLGTKVQTHPTTILIGVGVTATIAAATCANALPTIFTGTNATAAIRPAADDTLDNPTELASAAAQRAFMPGMSRA